jgi:hypothetical protein
MKRIRVAGLVTGAAAVQHRPDCGRRRKAHRRPRARRVGRLLKLDAGHRAAAEGRVHGGCTAQPAPGPCLRLQVHRQDGRRSRPISGPDICSHSSATHERCWPTNPPRPSDSPPPSPGRPAGRSIAPGPSSPTAPGCADAGTILNHARRCGKRPTCSLRWAQPSSLTAPFESFAPRARRCGGVGRRCGISSPRRSSRSRSLRLTASRIVRSGSGSISHAGRSVPTCTSSSPSSA